MIGIRDRTFFDDGDHKFRNFANEYFYWGGSHYVVNNILDRDSCISRKFVVIPTDDKEVKCRWKWITYLLLLPPIIIGIGLALERWISNYEKFQNSRTPPPRDEQNSTLARSSSASSSTSAPSVPAATPNSLPLVTASSSSAPTFQSSSSSVAGELPPTAPPVAAPVPAPASHVSQSVSLPPQASSTPPARLAPPSDDIPMLRSDVARDPSATPPVHTTTTVHLLDGFLSPERLRTLNRELASVDPSQLQLAGAAPAARAAAAPLPRQPQAPSSSASGARAAPTSAARAAELNPPEEDNTLPVEVYTILSDAFRGAFWQGDYEISGRDTIITVQKYFGRAESYRIFRVNAQRVEFHPSVRIRTNHNIKLLLIELAAKRVNRQIGDYRRIDNISELPYTSITSLTSTRFTDTSGMRDNSLSSATFDKLCDAIDKKVTSVKDNDTQSEYTIRYADPRDKKFITIKSTNASAGEEFTIFKKEDGIIKFIEVSNRSKPECKALFGKLLVDAQRQIDTVTLTPAAITAVASVANRLMPKLASSSASGAASTATTQEERKEAVATAQWSGPPDDRNPNELIDAREFNSIVATIKIQKDERLSFIHDQRTHIATCDDDHIYTTVNYGVAGHSQQHITFVCYQNTAFPTVAMEPYHAPKRIASAVGCNLAWTAYQLSLASSRSGAPASAGQMQFLNGTTRPVVASSSSSTTVAALTAAPALSRVMVPLATFPRAEEDEKLIDSSKNPKTLRKTLRTLCPENQKRIVAYLSQPNTPTTQTIKCGKDTYQFTKNIVADELLPVRVTIKKGMDGDELVLGFTKSGVLQLIVENGNSVTDVSKIPSKYDQAIETLCRSVFMATSSYTLDSTSSTIILDHTALWLDPFYHLNELMSLAVRACQKNSGKQTHSMSVSFIDESFKEDKGFVGGEQQILFYELYHNIFLSSEMVYVDSRSNSRLKCPRASATGTHSRFAELNPSEAERYENIGRLLMYTFLCNKLYKDDQQWILGRRLPRAIFHAIFTLTPEDIEKNFSKLEDATLFRIYQHLIKNDPDAGANPKALVTLYEQLDDSTKLEEVRKALETTYGCAGLFPQDTRELTTFLRKEILKRIRVTEEGSSLAVIHQMAQGMYDILKQLNRISIWDLRLRDDVPKMFDCGVQGTIDKETCIESIKVQLADSMTQAQKNAIEAKAGWLKEWIANEATPEEVEQTLFFWTGCNGLRPNAEMETERPRLFIRGHREKVIKATFCSARIFLCVDYISPESGNPNSMPDNTKENFIKTFKKIVLGAVQEFEQI